MKYQLKKIKSFPEGSEETPCFRAEIWVDGKHIAYVENDGHGASNLITHTTSENKELARSFDNLDTEADIFELVYEDMDRKKNQSKGFVLVKDGETYVQKFPMPISRLKQAPNYKVWVEKELEKLKADGYRVLNTNL